MSLFLTLISLSSCRQTTEDETSAASTEEILPIEDWLREHPEDIGGSDGETETETSSENDKEEEEDTGLYAYSILDSRGKKVYAEVYDCLANLRSEVKVSTTDKDFLDKCFNYCIMDHPEIFYVKGYRTKITSLAGKVTDIRFSGHYTMTGTEVRSKLARIDEEVEKIIENAPFDDSDYEKAKYVFDYIVQNTGYNINAPDNQNILSVFLNHESVCQGYSLAVKYLLDRLDVPCAVIYGEVDGTSHAWNLAKLDGTYCYIDATWGDQSFRSSEKDEVEKGINYNYFACNDEILKATHKIKSPDKLPECLSLDKYYYVMEGLFFRNADIERLRAVFRNRLSGDENYFTIRCETGEVYDELKEQLIDDRLVFEFMPDSHKVVYAMNEIEHTMTFWLND